MMADLTPDEQRALHRIVNLQYQGSETVATETDIAIWREARAYPSEDSKRMDWLESKRADIVYFTDGYVAVEWLEPCAAGHDVPRTVKAAKTLREAIDAAIRERAKGLRG